MRRYRSRLDQPNGYGLTHGAMYWQLNDESPIASWASLEYGTNTVTGRWKVQHYMAKRFFAPITAVPVIDFTQGRVDVYGTNDEMAALPAGAELVVEVWAWNRSIADGPRHTFRQDVSLKPQSSSADPLWTRSFAQIA